MKEKPRQKNIPHGSGGFEHLPDNEFYTGSPREHPLNEDRRESDFHRNRNTSRHQESVSGRPKPTVDPRERRALLGILRSIIIIILLMIAFFMLWQGVRLYEERVFIENQTQPEISPVMRSVPLMDQFDIEENGSEAVFSTRIENWKEANRLVRSAEGLLLRNNYDQAVSRCQDALRLAPTHMGALERLGRLYFQKGLINETVNTYVRLLGIDPTRADLKELLIEALDANADADAVVLMARWYLEQNSYSENVQRYLANALFQKEEYVEAITAYDRVLTDNPKDTVALNQQATAYMVLDRYDEALAALDLLHDIRFRDPKYYRQLAVCYAQLNKGIETVKTLGKASHLFGQDLVVGWIQDPKLDPVREDRDFQAFTDRVGGEEFRKWLEEVSRSMDGPRERAIEPQLTLPDPTKLDTELLQRRK